MVQLIVRMTARSGRAHQLLEALRARMWCTQRQSGCSDAHIAADVDEADAFWCFENWENAALEDELRTDRFSQLLALMETSARPPLLEFRMIAETRGLEYVTAVREASDSNERARP
jgi:quinol monooxygenase YgiN